MASQTKKQSNLPKDLQQYSREHLLYEVAMFFQLGRLLMSGLFHATPPEVAAVIQNAALESFALHLRNLLDFFYSTPAHDTDVKAAMFYDNGQLPIDFPQKSDMLIKAHLRAHKEMSHLTTERHPEGSPMKVWQFHVLMREIKPLLEKFIRTAPAARLDPKFIDDTAKLLATTW